MMNQPTVTHTDSVMQARLTDPQVPPKDVLQQIAFYAPRGPSPIPIESDKLVLDGFAPNRSLIMSIVRS